MQKSVKLVCEILGADGCKPNPVMIKAICNWPAINNLKDLQSFLGTTNYVRPHAGPAYGRIMGPLRALLKADAVFPPSAEHLAAIEALKMLVVEDHLLAVPDEQAAIEAARARLNGDAPVGRPYEMGADTSNITMGGVMGQAQSPGGRLMPLQYFSAPLSPSQSLWASYEQGFVGSFSLSGMLLQLLGGSPWSSTRTMLILRGWKVSHWRGSTPSTSAGLRRSVKVVVVYSTDRAQVLCIRFRVVLADIHTAETRSILLVLGIGRSIAMLIRGIQAKAVEDFGDEDPVPYAFDIAEFGEWIPLDQLMSHVVKLRSLCAGVKVDLRVDFFDEVGRLWLSETFPGVTQLDGSVLKPFILDSSASIVAVVVRRMPEEAVVYSAAITNPYPRVVRKPYRSFDKAGSCGKAGDCLPKDKVRVASASFFFRCYAPGCRQRALQGDKYEPDCSCKKCGRLMCYKCATERTCGFVSGGFVPIVLRITCAIALLVLEWHRS